MGDNIFSSREQMLKSQAMAAYQNSFNQLEIEKENAKEKASLFDEAVKGITEPIGGLLVGKPFEKVVKSGIKKVLGKGVKLFKDKALETLKNASNGDLSAFGKNLSSKTTQNIKDLLGDNVPENISKNFSKLSSKAQNTINAAREKLGKKKIGQDDEPENDPVEADTPDAPADVSDVADVPDIASDAPAMDTADLDSWLNGAAGSKAASPYDGQTQVDPHGLNTADDAPDLRLGQGVPRQAMEEDDSDLLARSNAVDQADASEQRLQEQSSQSSESQPSKQPDTTEQLDAQPDGDPNAQASSNAEKTDTGDGDDDSIKPTDESTTPAVTDDVGTDVGKTLSTTEDVTSGLEDAAAGIEAAAGAEGGLNIFADIAAGIAGLATLIGGAETKSKPKAVAATLISSGVQFGI